MACTTTEKDGTITITSIDADWTAGTDCNLEYMFLQSIQFIPSSATDRMIIRDGGIDEIKLFDSGVVTASGSPIFEDFTDDVTRKKPVIDVSDCTIASADNAELIIKLK